jgi:hypothetical protein
MKPRISHDNLAILAVIGITAGLVLPFSLRLSLLIALLFLLILLFMAVNYK